MTTTSAEARTGAATTTTTSMEKATAATTGAAAGRRAEADRRYERVLATITAAIAAGNPAILSVSGVARVAGVHRSYLYRHPALVDLLQEAAREPASGQLEAERVSAASLRADLAHARDRAHRAETEARRLRLRLSEALGEQIWAETGLGPVDEAAKLHREVERLRQEKNDLTKALDERDSELDAARAANRELMAAINSGTDRSARATTNS